MRRLGSTTTARVCSPEHESLERGVRTEPVPDLAGVFLSRNQDVILRPGTDVDFGLESCDLGAGTLEAIAHRHNGVRVPMILS
jgi:hypothetical protein